MKNFTLLLLLYASLIFASCTLNLGEKTEATANDTKEKAEKSDKTEDSDKTEESEDKADKPTFPADKEEAEKTESKTQTDCKNLKREGMKLDKKQTFPLDFEPYKGACFATFHEPEFDDPPLGEWFYIYKDGKEIFEFPDKNQAATYTVEAVAFQDLNGDKLTDIIVVGYAGAKSGRVYSNQVYTNTGKDFYTDRDANLKLDDFTKIKDVVNFAKQNKQIFFP